MTSVHRGEAPVILFDGLCNLCNRSVAWVIKRDRRRKFRFASLQSDAARRVIEEAAAPCTIDDLPDSVVLVDDAGVHTHSTAAIRIARGLGVPWSLAVVFLVVPRPLRDWVYVFIAQRRYRWFGKREACMIPTPDVRARFLDADEIDDAGAP